jgi:hypothetical protein
VSNLKLLRLDSPMAERGVSQLVSVDLEGAVKLREAS